jgi:hypothetical protein
MKRFFGILVALVAVVALVPAAHALSSGNATVTLAASASTIVQVLDPAIVLVPTTTDYDNDFVDAAGASGLRVRVKSNSSTGMILKVRCPDAAPQIALADLLVKTASAAGAGGTTLAAYTAISGTDQNLWSTGAAQPAWATITTDIRIQNLINYPDAGSAGTSSYSNTLTYTVVTQ